MYSRNNFYRNVADEGQGSTTEQDTGDDTLDKLIDATTDAPERTGTEDAQGTDTDRQQQTPQQGQPDGGQSQRPAGADNNTQQQPQGIAQQQRLPADAKGNLVDPRTGAIIATAGDGRRWYEENRRTSYQLTQAKQQIDQINVQLQAYKEANAAATQLELQPAETLMAMQLFANYKKDPIATFKWMLTEAQAAGHNLSSIFPNGAGAFDPAAIKQMIASELAPLRQASEREQAIQQAGEEGRQETEAFYAEHPDAQMHENVLVSILQREMETLPRERWASLETHYYKLKTWALEKGLDWNRPLAPQLNGDANATGNQQQPMGQQRPMLTHGVPPTGRGGNIQPRSNGAVASENMTSAEIVREALAEAKARGMQFPS